MDVPLNDRKAFVAKVMARSLPAWRGQHSDSPDGTGRTKGQAVRPSKMFGLRGYETYRAHQLRTDYSELEMNLQSLVGHYADRGWFDILSAEQAVAILDASRTELERDEPNAEIVDQDLGRARRLMVWLYPPDWLSLQADAIRMRLDTFSEPEARGLKLDAADRDGLRFQLDEAIGLTNRLLSSRAINNGLQLRRLEMVRNLGFVTIAALLLFAPVLVDGSSLGAWSGGPMGGMTTWAVAWITTAAIALVGATGAALSGLLQARDAPVRFEDYQVRGHLVMLRTVVGTVVAMILYFLLSWQVLPAMAVSNPGTYLLVAFLAGFSERFFLGLLGLEKDGDRMSQTPMTPIAPPPKPGSSDATADGKEPH